MANLETPATNQPMIMGMVNSNKTIALLPMPRVAESQKNIDTDHDERPKINYKPRSDRLDFKIVRLSNPSEEAVLVTSLESGSEK